MKILLLQPTGSNWLAGGKDVSATANRMAPLGLLSMAACLRQRGHDVSVYDGLGPFAAKHIDAQVAEILLRQPDLLGVSATTSAFYDGYEIARAVKRKRPGIQIVFGGVHVSAIGAPLLERFAAIDCLCMGEGERTICDLADGLAPAQINGLIYRESGRMVQNPPCEPIARLDDLPFPLYQKLAGFPHHYHLPLFSYTRRPGATMVTSRGCPYQCSYCDRSVFKNRYRHHSAEYVYAHMRYLRQRFGVRHINFYDDLFTVQRRRIFALCDMLQTKPLGIQFNCAVRVGHADARLLAALKHAGCLQVSVGIETGDADMMATHKPGVGIQGVRRTVADIQAAGLRVKGLFMMGLPGESAASIRQTSDFAMSLNLDDMNMSKFTPFHGAPVWSRVHREGRFTEDWRKMNCLNFVYLPADIDSVETLDRLYNAHVKRFYSDKRWRRKFMRRLWPHRWSLWRLARHWADFAGAMRGFDNGPSLEKTDR